jgi:hypothetical protein
VELSKRDWAIRHLARIGNLTPSEYAINCYIEMLDEDVEPGQDQETRKWIREMYERDVKNFSGTRGKWRRRKT